MRTDEHDGSSQGAARYDLSKVPRPLYLQSLACVAFPTPDEWLIRVGDSTFSVTLARTPYTYEANQLVNEISDVLKAHRVLAGTTRFYDDYVR
jgi:hypothetical protein